MTNIFVTQWFSDQPTWPPQHAQELARRFGLALYEPDENFEVARDMRLLRRVLA